MSAVRALIEIICLLLSDLFINYYFLDSSVNVLFSFQLQDFTLKIKTKLLNLKSSFSLSVYCLELLHCEQVKMPSVVVMLRHS